MYLSQQPKAAEINRMLQILRTNNLPILGLVIPLEEILFYYIGYWPALRRIVFLGFRLCSLH